MNSQTHNSQRSFLSLPKKSRAFFSDTFTVSVSDSQDQVKEIVLIDNLLHSSDSPSVFLVFFDKRFMHVSLRNHTILCSGELITQDSSQFKRIAIRNSPTLFIAYVAQFKLNFIDITHQQMETQLFNINIPTHRSIVMSESERAILSSDGFSYESIESKSSIVTCEVLGVISTPSESSNFVICSIFNKDNYAPMFTFQFKAISRQINLCKLDASNFIGIYENHFAPIHKSTELVLHVQNISIYSEQGHKVLRLPLHEDSCVLSMKFLDGQSHRIMVVGNTKACPFVRIYSILEGESDPSTKIHIITDMLLSEIHASLLRRVIFMDYEHLLTERISEQGTYIEFMRFQTRTKDFHRKIQLLRNPHQTNRESTYWMTDSDIHEMTFFYKDTSYIQSVSAHSSKTLVYIDDHSFYNDLGNKPYQLIFHTIHFTSHEALLLHLMAKKDLISNYAEIHIKNMIDMLLQEF